MLQPLFSDGWTRNDIFRVKRQKGTSRGQSVGYSGVMSSVALIDALQ